MWGVRRTEEKPRLSRNARAILHVLRKEWEMSTSELREESGVKDHKAFTRAVDELRAAMIVVPRCLLSAEVHLHLDAPASGVYQLTASYAAANVYSGSRLAPG